MKKRIFYITENQKKELYKLVQEDSSNIAGIPSLKPENNDEEEDEDEYEVDFDDEDGEEDEEEEFI